jgi:hypothetical protein
MDTYSVRAARSKTTGHYRRPGTRTLFCGRPAGAPNTQFATLTGWKMCTRCVKAEAADRAEAEAVAAQYADPQPMSAVAREAAAAQSADRYIAREFPAVADLLGLAAVAEDEARLAAALVTEAEATEGTWRGQWIGPRAADTLFDLDTPTEQGALFA